MPAERVLILGDGPEAPDLAAKFRESGRAAALIAWEAPRIEPNPSDPLLAQAGREAHGAGMILEFVEGSLEGKRAVLEAVAEANPRVLLSSALRAGPTEIGSWLPWPERVVGFSGLFPGQAQRRIELQRGLETGGEAWEMAEQLWGELGLEAEALGDHPGGVQARLVCCIINEAVGLLSEEGASAADIDAAMKLGTHYPHGPLEWADRIGLDRVLAVLEGLEREYHEDRYRSAPLLRKLVLAGRLGAKSGRGFFTHKM